MCATASHARALNRFAAPPPRAQDVMHKGHCAVALRVVCYVACDELRCTLHLVCCVLCRVSGRSGLNWRRRVQTRATRKGIPRARLRSTTTSACPFHRPSLSFHCLVDDLRRAFASSHVPFTAISIAFQRLSPTAAGHGRAEDPGRHEQTVPRPADHVRRGAAA